MAWLFLGLVCATAASLMFSTLTYSLRDYSRPRLEDYLNRHKRSMWTKRTIDLTPDLIFTTAIGRMIANLLILIFVLHMFFNLQWSPWPRYGMAVAITAIISLFCSVAVPHSLARHAAEAIIGSSVLFLHAWRTALQPATRLMHFVDDLVCRLTHATSSVDAETQKEEDIQQEIIDAVEEGTKEGVVDQQEREMIESVIEFRDTHAGEIMTPRPQIVALEDTATLDEVKKRLEESGHSRLPVYEKSLDHIAGVLHARDLLKHLGAPPEKFNIRTAMRQAYYVPETKPLRDLLADFRLQKMQIAIVNDEYGGTAGLVTIEDVLEELVGEISDEHEPAEPPTVKRINDTTAEVDAQIDIDELNRIMGMNLPEDDGYDTLGGYLSTSQGRIPQLGATITANGVRFTILEAEPQKVNRVKIELLPAAEAATNAPV